MFAVDRASSKFIKVDDLQRELEQLRESNRAIQAEKSALQQQLADQEAVICAITDENERQVGEVRRLLQLVQQRDKDNTQLQAADREQEHLAAQQREANELQEQITRMASQLDDEERQLQQQEEKMDDMRSTIEELKGELMS